MMFLRREEHARITRMQWEREHAPSERGYSGRSNCAKINQELLGASERVGLGWLQPVESGDVINAARFKSQDNFSEVEPLHLRQLLCNPVEKFPFGPETEAVARRGPTGPAGALIGGRAADFFDEQGVDAAPGIEARDARQAAVDHCLDAINSERGFRDIGGNDGAPLLVMGKGGILFFRTQFAMKWKNNELIAHPRGPDRRDRAANLVFPGHEDQDVALTVAGDPLQLVCGKVPDRVTVAADGLRQIF